jgi:hypothetical protein
MVGSYAGHDHHIVLACAFDGDSPATTLDPGLPLPVSSLFLALRPVLDTTANLVAKSKTENESLVVSDTIIPGMIFQNSADTPFRTQPAGRSMKFGSYATDNPEESDGVHGVAPARADNRRERQRHTLEAGKIHHTCAVAHAAEPLSSALSQEKIRARH